MPLLESNDINEIFRTAISLGLYDSRGALLGGVAEELRASLPTQGKRDEQLLSDLHSLNQLGLLLDGTAPIESWLRNALMLSEGRVGGSVFERALQRCQENKARSRPTSAGEAVPTELVPGALVRPGAEPQSVSAWSWLQERSTLHAAEPLAPEMRGLAEHDWREVQPQLHGPIEALPVPRLALTGRGGIGKSFLLKAILRERDRSKAVPIYVTRDDLLAIHDEDLAAALGVARRAAQARGTPYLLLVDAFEAPADELKALRDQLAVLDRAAHGPEMRVVVATRATAWAQLAGSGTVTHPWARFQLSDWPEAVVEKEINASQRPLNRPDLIQILRTPLLLDLFLRTFGRDREVPAGLQTRHGILSAYWHQRVLPDDEPTSPERRQALLRCAATEAQGVSQHRGGGGAERAAYDRLASEGVLVIRGGTYAFRHPLLRDFAVMQWAFDGAGDADPAAARLAAIGPYLVQFGAIRAAMEAVCEPQGASALPLGLDPVALIASLAGHGDLLLMAADVLGELDDPAPLRAEPLFDAVRASAQSAAFAERAVLAAQLAQNRGWLDVLAALPESAAWADAKPWITTKLLLYVGDLVEASWRKVAAEGSPRLRASCQAVARRLRAWSQAERLQPKLLDNDAWALAHLIETVSEADPTMATVEWLMGHARRSWRIRLALSLSIRAIVAGAQAAGGGLDEDRVAELYLLAGSLCWEDGVVVPAHDAPLDPSWAFDWIERALLGNDRRATEPPGLLDLAPARFLPIAFGLLAGSALARQRRPRSWQPEPADARLHAVFQEFFDAIRREAPVEVTAIEEQLRPLCEPLLGEEEAAGRLVFDSYLASDRGTRLQSADQPAVAPDARGQRASPEVDPPTLEAFWQAVQSSRSTAARVILLRVLMESGAPHTARHAAIVNEILSDPHIYHDRNCRHWLWKAISVRWTALDEAAKETVLTNIAGVARTPFVDGRYAVAPLLCAVPEGDRPPALRPFLDLYVAQDCQPEPLSSPSSAPPITLDPASHDERFEQRLAGRLDVLGPACVHRWRAALGWRPEDLSTHPEALAGAIDTLRAIHTNGCLPEADVLTQNPWTLTCIGGLFEAIAQMRKQQKGSLPANCDVTKAEAHTIAAWALRLLERSDPDVMNADREPVPAGEIVLSREIGAECTALRMLNAVLAHPTLHGDLGLHRRLLDWLERVTERPSPRTAYHLFTSLGPDHWLRDRTHGSDLVCSLLEERISDGGALAWSIPLLSRLPPASQQRILDAWLARPRSERLTGASALTHKSGEYLGSIGSYAAVKPGLAWAREFVERLLARQPAEGALADAAAYGDFVTSVVFGAKEIARSGVIEPKMAGDVAALMELCWSAMQSVSPAQDERQRVRFASLVFHMLSRPHSRAGQDSRPVDLGPWWAALECLACRIVDEGSSSDIFDLVFALRKSPILPRLGAPPLRTLIERLAARVDREPPNVLQVKSHARHSWPSVLTHASELLEAVALADDADADLYQIISRILQKWANPPLSVERAVRASRRLRIRH